MKILCLSDLHICNSKDRKKKIRWIKSILNENPVDVIVISGDIFEYHYQYQSNPYQKLSEISDKPIICTLGNHEFVDNTIEKTLSYYKSKYEPSKYNVHYLDVCGYYDIDKYRFLGNWLCYDGSLRYRPWQDLYEWGNGCWLDKRIIGFDYEKENKRCVQQIEKNICDDRELILVTHCVPHKKMNGHYDESELNAFSGMYNLLKYYRFKYSISGHTHKKVMGLELEGCNCINIGNDYYPPYEYYIIEL